MAAKNTSRISSCDFGRASCFQRLLAAGGWLLVPAVILLAGCQTPQVVENYPPPNFNGPVIASAMISPMPSPTLMMSVPKTSAPLAHRPPASLGAIPADWIPLPGAHRQWDYIVIHHSATTTGSVADFDREHREKGWDECGYDFVIGNGTHSGNGQIEVGSRWPKQKYGAHAKTPDERYNQHGIGICLVGNFDIDRPTAAQVQSLDKLVAYLMSTYNIPISRVIGHRDTGKATHCPGMNLSLPTLRRGFEQKLASAGVTIAEPLTSSADLLHDQQ